MTNWQYIMGIELARRAGSTKSAVSNAVKRGVLKKENNGLFDITNQSVKTFIAGKDTLRRAHYKQTDQNPNNNIEWNIFLLLVKALYTRILCVRQCSNGSMAESLAFADSLIEIFRDWSAVCLGVDFDKVLQMARQVRDRQ